MTQLALKVTLAETSRSGPALAHFDDPTSGRSLWFVAYPTADRHIIDLLRVDAPPGTMAARFPTPESTPASCSLTVHKNNVFIAWTGTGNPGQVNVSPVEVWANEQDPLNPIPRILDQEKATLAETSLEGPALASHGGQLFLAWTGVGNNNLNLMVSQGDSSHPSTTLGPSVQFGGKIILPETAIGSPSLASHNDRLFIAWTGSDRRLNIARVAAAKAVARRGDIVRFHIIGLTNKITLSETSYNGPALASYGGQLVVGWAGIGEGLLNFLFSRDNGATFQGKFTSSEKAHGALALAAGDGRLNVAWTGVDTDGHLNLAVLDPSSR